jgi:hypothetical protein
MLVRLSIVFIALVFAGTLAWARGPSRAAAVLGVAMAVIGFFAGMLFQFIVLLFSPLFAPFLSCRWALG